MSAYSWEKSVESIGVVTAAICVFIPPLWPVAIGIFLAVGVNMVRRKINGGKARGEE